MDPKLYNNDLISGRYRVPKLPPLSVKHVCSNLRMTNNPIVISKIVLKSVLWRFYVFHSTLLGTLTMSRDDFLGV